MEYLPSLIVLLMISVFFLMAEFFGYIAAAFITFSAGLLMVTFAIKVENKQKQKGLDEWETYNKYLIDLKSEIVNELYNTMSIPICSKCSDVKYFIESLNSLGTAIQLRCASCGKKVWIKSSYEDPNMHLVSLFNERSNEVNGTVWIGTSIYPEAVLNIESNSAPKKTRFKQRRSISSQVKQEVWQRDRGNCVECGSKEKLEYDHIIPFSKGGSNTARNIQLLCETCNRKKSAQIQ